MPFFMDLVFTPLLEACKPFRILEIGSGQGQLTRQLVTYCRTHQSPQYPVHLDVVDQPYQYDVDWVKRQYARWASFHQQASVDFLPEMAYAPDMVFLHGDMNWYTVFHELTHLQTLSRRYRRPMPVTVVMHVGWPYGRRDNYKAPEKIPSMFRHPYKRRGIKVGQRALSDDPRQGLMGESLNAAEPYGPRNGVLTAVEDFLKTSPDSMELVRIEGHQGLALLVHPQWVDTLPALATLLEAFRLSPVMMQTMQALERDRLRLAEALVSMQHQARTREAEQLLGLTNTGYPSALMANSIVLAPDELDIHVT